MTTDLPIDRQELLVLIDSFLSGEISPDDAALLKETLRDSQAARILYIEYVDIHCELQRHAFPSHLVPTESFFLRQIGGPRSRKSAWAFVCATALVLALLPAIWFVLENRPVDPQIAETPVIPDDKPERAAPVETEPPIVATLIRSFDAVWLDVPFDTEASSIVGFRAGEWIDLESGTVILQLENGVRCTTDGEVLMKIDDELNCSLDTGTATFEVPPGAKGFTVHTHGGSFVDFGTTFGVQVSAEGTSEVHVLKGIVEARLKESDERISPHLRLTSQDSARMELATGKLRPIRFAPEDFERPLAISSGVQEFSNRIRFRWRPLENVVPTQELDHHPVWLCRERSSVVLKDDLSVIHNSVADGTSLIVNIDDASTVTVPAGTRLDSYLLNVTHTNGAISGTVTFQSRIAAVLLSSDELDSTDTLFCHPETTLELNDDPRIRRGANELKDHVRIQDNKTLQFHLTVDELPNLDQMRILVYSDG